MLCAHVHRSAGYWPREAADAVTLDFEGRHRRRARITTDNGEDILIELEHAIPMADGDGLLLEDGRWIEVRAAPEQVLEIRHQDIKALLRMAWHLGNRHVPTDIRPDALRVRADHIAEEMLRGFHANLERVLTAFQPEGGAYSHYHFSDGGQSHG